MAASQDVAKARFDADAADWDSNKKHVESVDKAFEAIKRYVPAFGDGGSKSDYYLSKRTVAF
jgi:hypothetical protein